MSRHKRRKRRRITLWREQSGLCKFCSVPMVHWNDRDNDPGKKTPDVRKRFATIDHLCDRWHPERNDGNPNHEQRWVLSCWQCNFNRGKESQAAVPIEILRECSRRHPQIQEAAE